MERIGTQDAEIKRLHADLNEADRRAGAAERHLATLEESERRRDHWLREAKERAGYDHTVSFDTVFEDLLAAQNKTHPPMPFLRCRFEPQLWVCDYAVAADPQGPLEWDVPLSEVKTLTGVTEMARMDDDPFARDELRNAENAPQWVKDWSGPFEVEWRLIDPAWNE